MFKLFQIFLVGLYMYVTQLFCVILYLTVINSEFFLNFYNLLSLSWGENRAGVTCQSYMKT